MSVEQIEQAVLNLSAEDRRRILDWLFAHADELAAEDNSAVVAEWKQETRRRVAEIQSGAVVGLPGEEVSARIRKIVDR